MGTEDSRTGGEKNGSRKLPLPWLGAALVVALALGMVALSRSSSPSGDGIKELQLDATQAEVQAGPEDDPDLPPYVYNSSQVLQAYQAAKSMPDMLAVMPCYCNCGVMQGHKSLQDCFFKEPGVYNDHAAFCDICDTIAIEAVTRHRNGAFLKDIRNFIDSKYSRFGTSTETPLPS